MFRSPTLATLGAVGAGLRTRLLRAGGSAIVGLVPPFEQVAQVLTVLIVVAIALLLFGSGRLPEWARIFGRGIAVLRRGARPSSPPPTEPIDPEATSVYTAAQRESADGRAQTVVAEILPPARRAGRGSGTISPGDRV